MRDRPGISVPPYVEWGMHTYPGPVVVSRRHQSGFTLVELMVVVGIIGLAFGYSSFVVHRSLQKTDTRQAIFQMKQRLQKARELSMVAGSRLETLRIDALGGLCPPGTEDGYFFIQITPANITYPAILQMNAGQLGVTCQVFDPVTATNGNWQIDALSTMATFAFGPTGSLLGPAGAAPPPGGVYLQFSNPDPNINTIYGLHIFPSGVICAASGFQLCDEDTGP